MGFTSIIGMVLSFAAIVVGIIQLGDIGDFIDVPSVLLTIIPTIGSLLSSCPLSLLAKIPSHFKVLMRAEYKVEDFVEQLLSMAQIARSGGALALEQQEDKITDRFLKYGIQMVTIGVDEVQIKDSLFGELAGLRMRHAEAKSVYDKAAMYAPAFGMCGTVISLINMLMNLDFSDPTAITSLGSNMSAALVTTFYGSLFANVLFSPIAGRLQALHKKEIFCKELMIDGVIAICRGENPSSIKDMFYAQLNEAQRKKIDSTGGKSANAERQQT